MFSLIKQFSSMSKKKMLVTLHLCSELNRQIQPNVFWFMCPSFKYVKIFHVDCCFHSLFFKVIALTKQAVNHHCTVPTHWSCGLCLLPVWFTKLIPIQWFPADIVQINGIFWIVWICTRKKTQDGEKVKCFSSVQQHHVLASLPAVSLPPVAADSYYNDVWMWRYVRGNSDRRPRQ